MLQYVRSWSTFSAPPPKIIFKVTPPPPLKKLKKNIFWGFTVVIPTPDLGKHSEKMIRT